MALSDLQKAQITGDQIRGNLQAMAGKMSSLLDTWERNASWMDNADATDLTEKGISASEITLFGQFRTAIHEHADYCDGGTIARTNSLRSIIDQIRAL